MKTFVIAEAGVNHNGSIDLAMSLVDAAAKAGADAIKFQTFIAEKVVQKTASKAVYQQNSTGRGTQFEMLKKLELNPEMHNQLISHCAVRGIEFMSTPFDSESADFLVSRGVKRLKIPSGELTNHPFLRHLAAKGLPLILSTGMATMDEIHAAVEVIGTAWRAVGFTDAPGNYLTILHCTSNYPARLEDVNLLAMLSIARETHLPVGYSDHTLGISVCTAAVALGAIVIEKHFTTDRSLDGPDHKASLEPGELEKLIQQVRDVEKALGSSVKAPTASELEMLQLARRSVVAARNLVAGEILTEEMLDILRPAVGIAPMYYDELIGRTLRANIEAGEALQWENIQRDTH